MLSLLVTLCKYFGVAWAICWNAWKMSQGSRKRVQVLEADKEAGTITGDNILPELSLSARLALALHCFERYCQKLEIYHPAVAEFLDYLWAYHTVGTPEELAQWDSHSADLVHTGLGDEFPESFEAVLQERDVEALEFRRLLEGVIEIIYGSFFSQAHDEESLGYLRQVLDIVSRRGVKPPSATVFLNSRFSDRRGWGKILSPAERDAWRHLSPQ